MRSMEPGAGLMPCAHSFTSLYFFRVPLIQVQSSGHQLGEVGALEEFYERPSAAGFARKYLQSSPWEVYKLPLGKCAYRENDKRAVGDLGTSGSERPQTHWTPQRSRMICVLLLLESFSHPLWFTIALP